MAEHTSTAEAWLASHLVAESAHDGGFDYRSKNGRIAVELKRSIGGSRDLHAMVMQLAVHMAAGRARRAWLIALKSKLAPSRIETEWQQVTGVLRPELANKLALLVLEPSGTTEAWHSAPLGELAPLRDVTKEVVPRAVQVHARREALPTPKFFDVFKVLLSTWLSRRGPLPINVLVELAGAAHPTVSEALDRLTYRDELIRHRNRSVELRAWPRATLAELLPLLSALRQTQWFSDRSGRSSPETLLRRLKKIKPPHVALGGAEAARVLDSSFDLVGLPRLDLTLHAPEGSRELTFVQKLDAALVPSETPHGAVLALHALTRRAPLFSEGSLPLADPAEIVLDLHELRLQEQIGDFVHALRGDKSL